jgi:protein O-GlcNAcase/histone acetyltransferase
MTPHEPSDFVSGVIEGFYGQPWTPAERLQLFDWMAAWGLNTYLYAPKDDLHHRALWREPYAEADAEGIRQVIRACRERSLRFVYGLSPGLDIRYSREADLDRLRARFEEMLALGCSDFALLFDDIPDVVDARDLERWGSLARAQCHVANVMFDWTRARRPAARFFFCPTAYCGRMAAAHLGGEDYLPAVGRELLPEIGVFWTGPDIVSREISVGHVREVHALLGRKPVIWDNLHANDYDGRRFFCGPYAGRAPGLRAEIAGVLSNPNTEFPLNYVPLRTFAAFVAGRSGDVRSAYLSAMREWAPSFTTVRGPLAFDDLVLFGDCYYLPYEEGPEASALYDAAARMVTSAGDQEAAAAFRARATRLRAFCAATTELCSRPLFHAISRRTWELREELDLLERFAARAVGEASGIASDFHLPGTFRGGFVARLQRLLVQRPDGRFTPPLTEHRLEP